MIALYQAYSTVYPVASVTASGFNRKLFLGQLHRVFHELWIYTYSNRTIGRSMYEIKPCMNTVQNMFFDSVYHNNFHFLALRLRTFQNTEPYL